MKEHLKLKKYFLQAMVDHSVKSQQNIPAMGHTSRFWDDDRHVCRYKNLQQSPTNKGGYKL